MNNFFKPISLFNKILKKDFLDTNKDTHVELQKQKQNEKFEDINNNETFLKPLHIDNINIYIDNHIHEYNYQELTNTNEILDENKINKNKINTIKNDNSESNNIIRKSIIYIKKIIPCNNTLIYCLKKLFMFMFHLTLISIFEIIFFFKIVSLYENEAIIDIIINFFSDVPNICNTMSITQKESFTIMFESLVNISEINNKANVSRIERKIFNNKLFISAWTYFLIIIGIDIFLILVKIYYKIKINFKKIIFENVCMILILAIYEYFFFKSIILLYQNISQNELVNLIVNEFNTCLIN